MKVPAEPGGGAPPVGFREALGRLRSAQKSAKGVSLYSRYVNRPAGRVLAAAAYRAGTGPDQVTLASGALSFAGIALVALLPPSLALGVGVYALLVAGYALDSADGQLARLRRVSSPAGEWLDHVVDCVKITALHAAVLISWYRFAEPPHPAWLLVPLVFQLAAVTTYCGGLLTEKLKPRPAPGAAPPQPSTVRAVALLPVDYGVVCLVFLLLGSPAVFRWGYAALALAAVVLLGGFLAKWYRELAVAPRAAPTASPLGVPAPVNSPRSG
ncbi:CDP-alcohol phosphatidyltransferase family protein [Streptomyces lonarensis]|uniref:CDP-alcohol phosphatidyltransferase family protein n=1 Tax=Streptomyces lonarensis TaxID=700599 RepID=A0A7X6I0V6_9ACTN|nr:CDP-alcohol phosphatidyltransferase family protein [Streptomyces lonarensis]NJQ08066.1 CDP-alcohol phosphatidyltransferase family protein [Streptomyces lonarensis]